MSKHKERIIFLSLIALTLMFIVNLVLIYQIKNDGNIANPSQTSSIQINDETTEVVKKVSDSVVTVALFRGDNIVGNGSGSIISYENGKVQIITNNHVIDHEANLDIRIIFANKETVKAKVIGQDAIADLALLEADVDFKVTPIEIGDSDKLQAGESVIAIGSPLDIEFTGTVTRGIISGLNRTIEVDNKYAMQVLQTDTTINPGNSGGPLINMAGQMIGINTSKISQVGFEGMGFAIPSNEAVAIIDQLKKNGKVERPTLGISFQSVSAIPEYARSNFNIPSSIKEGLYVIEVTNGSVAAKAGIKAEDIIYSFDGKEITSTSMFTTNLYSKTAGDKIELGIYRNGKKITVTVTL